MNIDLAQQLVAHPRWSWREGMRASDGVRVVDLDLWSPNETLPDLDDFPTAGAMLGMLAELGTLSDVVVQGEDWIVAVELPQSGVQGWAAGTLGEAAGWALIAAWGALPAPEDELS
ncbi:MAG: hypothetical protein AAGA48_05620 [Myxococcota bacterium]